MNTWWREASMCLSYSMIATLDLADSEDIGHQVAGELGVDYHEYIADSIYLWIQETRETRDLVERCSGYRAPVLQWMNLVRAQRARLQATFAEAAR